MTWSKNEVLRQRTRNNDAKDFTETAKIPWDADECEPKRQLPG